MLIIYSKLFASVPGPVPVASAGVVTEQNRAVVVETIRTIAGAPVAVAGGVLISTPCQLLGLGRETILYAFKAAGMSW
jgi:hypothetical protein